MHQIIQDYLEDYLKDPQDRAIAGEFQKHLASCLDCANDIKSLQDQNRMFASLRGTPGFEPAPGFYARVINRIEDVRAPQTFWSAFLEPAFGRRLAFTCAALVLLMGSYLVTSERSHFVTSPTGVVTQPAPFDTEEVQPGQRDAVLVNLASYHE